ncbi:hypothetical protein GF325_09415 [Candidatus Bathyarchaeota archaeon]|nr:hypothetical protein [Candidatus Bathyarchaeota archaeon]
MVDWIVPVTIAFTMAFAFGIGSNDETMATTVGTGGIRLKRATLLAAILATAGSFFLSDKVARSIGTGLINLPQTTLETYQPWILLAVLVAVSSWLILASRIGAPVSGTHSVVGAIIGVAACAPFLGSTFIETLKLGGLFNVILGWIFSPLLGLGCAILVSWVTRKAIKTKIRGLQTMERFERNFMILLVILVAFNQLNRAGNDAGNALGIFHALVAGNQVKEDYLMLLLGGGSISIGLGLFIVGRRLLKSVGTNIIELRPSDAFCIETSVLIVLTVCNLLGLPISGSHVLIFAIIGVALVKREPVDKKSLRRIAFTWIVTFPVTALICAAVLIPIISLV